MSTATPNIMDDMRSGPGQRPRGRFNANRPYQQQPQGPQNSQTFSSNGPHVKIRGSAQQIVERYLALAREAATSGDRIAVENMYQHAEHYFRLVNAHREGNQPGADHAGRRRDELIRGRFRIVDRFEPKWDGAD